MVIGTGIGALGAVASFGSAVIADLPANAGWMQVAFVVATIGLPSLQAYLTRRKVFSQATVERNIPVA